MARPFIPAPNQAAVEFIYAGLSQRMENQWHVSKGSPFTLAELQQLRAIFNQWDIDWWRIFRSSSVNLVMIRSRGLDTLASPLEEYTTGLPRAGSYPGTLLPLNVTCAIKMTSGNVGRSTRGRVYLPGLTTSGVTGQTVIPGGYDNAGPAIMQLVSRIQAWDASWHLCITSYRFNKAWRVAGVPYTVTSASISDYNVDSMRRRLTGRGI